MSLAVATPTAHALISVGQQFKALSRKTTSPEGIEWDYPYGKGAVTTLCVSEAGEPTEFGVRSFEAVWYRFVGSDDVRALHPHYFLQSFTRI